MSWNSYPQYVRNKIDNRLENRKNTKNNTTLEQEILNYEILIVRKS